MLDYEYKRLKLDLPGNVIVIDNLIKKDFLDCAIPKFLGHSNNNVFQSILNDPDKIKYMALPSIELTQFFISKEFINLLFKETNCKWQLNKEVWIQLRVMTPDSPPLQRHTDKIGIGNAVCLFYINNDWLDQNGGELNFYKSFHESEDNAIKVKPIYNRMVFFEANEQSIHSVSRVYNRCRYVVVSEWTKI